MTFPARGDTMQEEDTNETQSKTVFHVDFEEEEKKTEPVKKEKGGKKLGFVILFIVVISLTLGYAFSYFIHHRPAEYGDRDSSTHEIYVRESKELSNAVNAIGRDPSDIDALIEQYRKTATTNGTFVPKTFIWLACNFVNNNLTMTDDVMDYQPVDVTFSTLKGNCVAKSILLAYMYHQVNIPCVIISFRPINKLKTHRTGHMLCQEYTDTQSFINGYDELFDHYNAQFKEEENMELDYAILWKI